ncbi:MAG: putative Ig domain-containing protein [Deltaproteobacteria bacterium]
MTTIRKSRFLFNTAMLSAVLLASCGRVDDGKGAPKTLNGGPPAASFDVAARGAGQGALTVIPAIPTAVADLQAVYSGKSVAAAYRWERNGAAMEGEDGDRLVKGKFRKGDEIRVVSTVDGVKESFSVVIGNSPPSASKISFSPESAGGGVDVTATVEGKDPDAEDAVKFDYQWIINGREAAMQTDPVLKGDLIKRGDTVALRVTPYDGTERGQAMTSLSVTVKNSSPAITSTPPKEFSARTYTYQAAAQDPDGDAVSFSLTKAPEGMKIGAGGRIEWPLKQEYKGAYEVTVEADDGHGGKATQDFSITLGASGGG